MRDKFDERLFAGIGWDLAFDSVIVLTDRSTARICMAALSRENEFRHIRHRPPVAVVWGI
jgi:hypothetical protein